MLGRDKPPRVPPVRYGLPGARIAGKPQCLYSVMTPATVAAITEHLGGDAVLARIGAHGFVADHDNMSFRIDHPNPNHVHVVVISSQPHGFFNMDCYGRIPAGALSAPLIGTAKQILPENLATVLGKLTGTDAIHHHHF